MNLLMVSNHAIRFGIAAQVENLKMLQGYARSLLKGNRPEQDCSGNIISHTRFVTLAPSAVKPDRSENRESSTSEIAREQSPL